MCICYFFLTKIVRIKKHNRRKKSIVALIALTTPDSWFFNANTKRVAAAEGGRHETPGFRFAAGFSCWL